MNTNQHLRCLRIGSRSHWRGVGSWGATGGVVQSSNDRKPMMCLRA